MRRQLTREGEESFTDLSTDFVDRLESRQQGIGLGIEVNVISQVFGRKLAAAQSPDRRKQGLPTTAAPVVPVRERGEAGRIRRGMSCGSRGAG